jgi:putative oxidoreductase
MGDRLKSTLSLLRAGDIDGLASAWPFLRRPLLVWRSPTFPSITRAAARVLILLYFYNFSATWLQYAYYGYWGDWYLGPFWAVVAFVASVLATVTSIAAARPENVDAFVSSSSSSSNTSSSAARGVLSRLGSLFAGFRGRVAWLGPYRLHAFVVIFLLALREMVGVFWHQVASMYTHGHGVFINELLTKKLAVCASAALLVAEDPLFRARIQGSAYFGGIVSLAESDFDENRGTAVGSGNGQRGAEGDSKHSKKRSAFLLAARLMIGLLFLYVGFYEVKLQIQRWTGWIAHNGHAHVASTEDGHNQMWAKFTQLVLGLPLVLGFRTRQVATMISIVCILESFIQWPFWATPFGVGYSIHARDHFVVNLAVAGGLWLLASLGAGKFSVDAMLKKRE